MKKALFLDRDGVINVDKKYVHKIEDFEFCDGIFKLCRIFTQKNYL
ncbi:D,D-heptose 1,7-bisphosphate phosphatase, partial [Campylobacter upsaliensis]|nr:D,D-heptose 1,7-bisphosphate phosphatase [Campylobacter upsaliensis]